MEEVLFVIPPFVDKVKPKAPEKPLPTEKNDDPYGGNMINSIVPNFKKRTANLHYISEVTGECGTILIRPGVSEDDIMDQYAKKFPRECKFFLMEIKAIGQSLFDTKGMSRERQLMSLTKIPQLLYLAMQFLDENYWADTKRYYRFIRKYPKFMIGDHQRKYNSGIIVK